MTPLSYDDLEALAKLVRDQLADLRRTRDSLDSEGKMTQSLYIAICRECDRLNQLESRINAAMTDPNEP